MDALTRRIVVLGKTGAGKSSIGNTIFGETAFEVDHSANSGTNMCKGKTRSVSGRRITWIDTPGFFDTKRSEEEMKSEIVRCFTECAPGPHAFLIVLKVEKYTEQEQEVEKKLLECFSEEALKYSIVLFTHGDQLQEGKTIKWFVERSKDLSDLVRKCGGRCHVIDNKYWKNNQQDEYRSNQFQVEELLKTIDKMTEAKERCYFTNKRIQQVNEKIEKELVRIRQSSPNMSPEEMEQKAKTSAFEWFCVVFSGVAAAALLVAFLLK